MLWTNSQPYLMGSLLSGLSQFIPTNTCGPLYSWLDGYKANQLNCSRFAEQHQLHVGCHKTRVCMAISGMDLGLEKGVELPTSVPNI